MIITKLREMDLLEPPVQEPVHAVQCDANTRAVAVTLTAGGVVWEPPAGVNISVAFKKPDGKKGWYDKLPDGSSACSVSGNVVTAILAPEALTAAGKVDAVLVFQDKDLNQLATFGFTILVEPNPAAGREISNDYYNYSTMEAVNQAMDSFFAQAEADYGAFTQKVETEQTAFLETATQALSEMHSTVTAAATGIVCEASGTVIAVADSSDRMLQGLQIFGRTVQDGTPSPDAPVELVSVGNSGSVGLTVAGKNLLTYPYYKTTETINGITFTDNGDGTITADGTATADAYFYCARDNKTEGLFLCKGTYTISGCPAGGSNNTYAFKAIANVNGLYASDYGSGATGTAASTASCTGVAIVVRSGVTVTNLTFKPQIEVGSVATEYEPYRCQTIIPFTPNGLPGIPVTSGGNYTDASGQQWICDEIDFARGVYVQRVLSAEVGASDIYAVQNGNAYVEAFPSAPNYYSVGLCTHAKFKYASQPGIGYCSISPNGVLILGTDKTSLDDFKAWLGAAKIQVLTPTQAAPVETPLSAEELAAYAALHTNKPNTTLHNDAGAHMELSYVADTKLYIDQKFTALEHAILSAGANV